MSSRRALKVAQAIREVVSTAILLEIKDPRVRDVTVTLVEVAGDIRNAKVYVSVMGNEAKQNLCLRGLQSSSGYLQKKIGTRIDTRYTPRLSFALDKGQKNAMEVTRILQEVLPDGNKSDEDDMDDENGYPRTLPPDPESPSVEDGTCAGDADPDAGPQ
jgi:ribosome-binding factor A